MIVLKQSFKITILTKERRTDMHTSLTQEGHRKREHSVQMLACLTL